MKDPIRAVSAMQLALLIVACAPPTETFTPVADVKDLMLSVLEPAAETYWDGVGEILDEEGVHEIRPQTDEDWDRLRNAGFVIAESGNLLMIPGRARDRGQWKTLADAMVETGRMAIRAVDDRDVEAVFDAGAEVYYACANCHAAYAAETLRPSDDRSQEPAGANASASEHASDSLDTGDGG